MKILRIFLIFYASICLIGGAALIFSQKGGWVVALGIYFMISSIVIFAGTLFEKRYKSKKISSSLKPTGEKFIDHKSGKVIEVYSDPETGERSYIDK